MEQDKIKLEESKKKNKKFKHKYSYVQSLSYCLKRIWETDKRIVAGILVLVPIGVIVPAMGVYFPKLLLQELETKQSPEHMLIRLAIFSFLLILITIFQKYLNAFVVNQNDIIRINMFPSVIVDTMANMDYEHLEDSEFNKFRSKVMDFMLNGQSVCFRMTGIFYEFFSNFLGLAVYSLVISTLTPLIFLIVAVTTIANYVFTKLQTKYEESQREARSDLDQKQEYILHKTCDFPLGKDLRLYNMEHWISTIFQQICEGIFKIVIKVERNRFIYSVFNSILLFARDGFAYGYLIYCVVFMNMTISDFSLYLGIIIGLSSWFSSFINSFDKLKRLAFGFSDVLEMISYKNSRYPGKELIPKKQGPCTLEFVNVSFRYPNAQEDTIHEFNLKIKAGEKLAIVGVNGAGKTTLIKLLCGFYTPTQGKILFNGKDMLVFNREDYISQMSGVFQDLNFLPVTIGENISQCPLKDMRVDKIWKCLRLAGLEEKIESLPEGLHTLMEKSINDNAVDFSGGEKQKLALARSLYKNAPILILDEPTAALDPIAENEMYLKYAELSKNKTSVYISHRLSSTRFCDRIILLDGGKVTEEGTHEDLMKLGGTYARMFEIQSHYYNDQEEEAS